MNNTDPRSDLESQITFLEYSTLMFARRDNSKGDVAQEITSDSNFPRTNTKRAILEYFQKIGFAEQVIPIFFEMWGAYEFYLWDGSL